MYRSRGQKILLLTKKINNENEIKTSSNKNVQPQKQTNFLQPSENSSPSLIVQNMEQNDFIVLQTLETSPSKSNDHNVQAPENVIFLEKKIHFTAFYIKSKFNCKKCGTT